MGLWNWFAKKDDGREHVSDLAAFLKEHDDKGHHLYLVTRDKGLKMALALEPLRRHRNKYNDEVEDGGAFIFVEGEAAVTLGEWWKGSSAELSWDQSKSKGSAPFTPERRMAGSLTFTQVGKSAPFHDAYGLSWWSDRDDGKTLRTLLNFMTLPEARLIWHRYEPDSEASTPASVDPDIESFVGVWSRDHRKEGEVVIDPSEGSGFSVEGSEFWSEDLVIWGDGMVTVSGYSNYDGRLHDGVIEWTLPVDGIAPEGMRASSKHFEPYNGPVEVNENDLTIGGFKFDRVRDTKPT